MHPYDHARSSAKIHGGVWGDYFAVHAWFDATKVIQCRFTHRALRHHIEGVAEAVSNFGPSIGNRDGVKVATEQLGMQHLEEDCTHPPEATVWLIDFDAPDWLPISEPDSAELANASAARFGGDSSAYLELHAWFMETRNWSDGPEHLVFRHHAFGIFEAEARFGPVIALDNGKAVPTRVVAERHVQQVLGRVPSATDFLRRIKGERWMLQATSPRKLGLD
ncbi:DUF6915 family protein [Aquamicrobium defluvii]|uniref:DUF6915 domain-containing protein n=2 Tax=Hyphomicrobiales TaxID=356 RepID=A0A011TLH0_9HYPH|nr:MULTISPECIES: hypothetical protein [Hyphomicrobiales]EXL04892.1 hypothetical protein BG36_09300 [Aquamicrobium defluvii]EZQ14522.1 hypothetical protein CF98_18700 [Halopseudomonas bauzanensis]MBE0560619.1 hypothetical protein [Brucella anthropi]